MLLQQQIQEKMRLHYPHAPNPYLIFETRTDMNQFPYQRFFRGKFDQASPSVYGRPAGYAPIIESIPTANYTPAPTPIQKSDCFQNACSTILPCHSNQCVYTSP